LSQRPKLLGQEVVVCPDCGESMEIATSCTPKYILLALEGATTAQLVKRDTTYFDVNPRCHDCNIVNVPGNIHHYGCDVERCPLCERQLISCHHVKLARYHSPEFTPPEKLVV